MNFRTAGASAPTVAILLLGLAGLADQATAQYYPPPQAYDDAPFYDPAMVQQSPLPPIAGSQAAGPRLSILSTGSGR